MIMEPLLILLGPLEAHARPLWAPRSPTVALKGPSGPLGVLLESTVAPSIPFEALQGSLDPGIWAPARALGRPLLLLRLFGPFSKPCLILLGIFLYSA